MNMICGVVGFNVIFFGVGVGCVILFDEFVSGLLSVNVIGLVYFLIFGFSVLCNLLFNRLNVSIVRKIVIVGKSVMCGVMIIFVCVLLSIVFYFGVGGCVFNLRNDRFVVEIIDVLICIVKKIIIDEIVFGNIWLNKIVVLLVLILWVDLINVCCFKIRVFLCIR